MTLAPAWDLYRSFLAVLRLGSLSAAARDLSLTQPTIGRHIAELEESLKTPLFVRSQSGLAPTQAAGLLLPHAEAMAAAAEALLRTASGDAEEPKGTVRLTASEVVGVEVLPPILAAFQETHPKIALELTVSNRNQDLLRRDADIAVRMARPTQTALVARYIGKARIGLFGHRRYLARRGTPKTIAELAQHTLLGFDQDQSMARYFDATGIPLSRDMFALRSDNEHALMAALRAGFGVGACQVGIAAREPDLVALLTKEIVFDIDMWLCMHEDLRASRRVRLLFDHLAGALSEYVAIGNSEVRPTKERAQGRPASASFPRKPKRLTNVEH